MLNLDLLFERVEENSTGISIKNNDIYIYVKNKYDYMNAYYIKMLLSRIKKILHYNPKRELHINLEGRTFGDDSVIIYFELIIMKLYDYGYNKIYINFGNLCKRDPLYPLFTLSLLYNCTTRQYIDKEKFLKYWDKSIVNKYTDHLKPVGVFDADKIRLTIVNDGAKETASHVGSIVFDYLAKKSIFSLDYIHAAVNIVGEIIDNTLCHTSSDCVFSMKTCTLGNDKLLLSIVLLNLDKNLISSQIRESLENGTLKFTSKSIVEEAYEIQKGKFNDIYDVDFFSLVSAFQKGVTTRPNAKNNSGRGLTRFIKSILDNTYIDSCYVYSGYNLLRFKSNYLKVDSSGNIGFNKGKSYFSDVPDEENILKLEYYNSGTLYNLMLVYELEGRK